MIQLRCESLLPRVTFALLIASSPAVLGEEEPAPAPLPPAFSEPQSSPLPAPPVAAPEAARRVGDADQEVERARTLMLQDQLDEARAILAGVLEDNPEHAAAWRWLGLVELKQQKISEGIAALERGAQLAPQDLELKFELASAYEAAERPQEAAEIYQDLLTDDTARIEALFRLGRLYALTERVDQAIDAFEKVLAAQAQAPGRARDAVAQLDRLYTRRTQAWIGALERGEADAFTRAMVFGTAQVGKQRLDDAQKIFEAAIKASPQQAPGYYWLSRVLIARGQMAEGLKNLERASVLAPDNFRLKLELGRAYDVAGRADDAEKTFKDIVDRAQDPALLKESRRHYGLLRAGRMFQARDWTGALAIFQSLLDEEPDDPRLLELKAQALEELGTHSESDLIFTGLIERFPDDVVLRSRVAGVYERRGETTRAKQEYARILQLQPTGEPARIALDRLGLNRGSELLNQNLPAEALPIFESVLAIAPETPAANLGAGIAYHRLQRYAEAEAALRKVIEYDRNNLAALLELAQIYEKTGRTTEASRVFEDLERFTRTAEERQTLRERLGTLYMQEVDRVSEAFRKGATDTANVASLGERLVRRGFYEDAIKLLTAALERAPNDPRLHFWLGNAYMGMNQPDRALAEIERGTQLAPGNHQLLLELAEAYVQVGRFEDAERTFLDLIRRTRDEGLKRQAGRSLGLIRIGRLQQDQNYAGALVEYDKLLRDYPDDMQLMFDRGRLLTALGRNEEADKVFARLLELAPDNVNFRMSLGQVYRQTKRPEQAERIYQDLLERNPGLLGARLELGRLYQETDRGFDALREYGQLLLQTAGTEQSQQVVQLVEGITREMTQRGIVLLTQKKLGEAETFFSRLAEIQPRNGQLHYWLSQVYKEQQHFDRQVQELEKVVELQSANVPMKRRLAVAYADAGDATKAMEISREILAAFPYDSEVRLGLADLLERAGRGKEAREEYVTLLELNPAEEWRTKALDRLGLESARAHLERGETQQAVAAAQEVLVIVPDDPIAIKTLARIYHQAGRLEEAETAWRKVLDARPDDRNARLSLARIYAVTDREDEALKFYHALASEDPVTTQREDARKELDQLLVRRAERAIQGARDLRNAELMQKLLPVGTEAFDLGGLAAAQQVFEYLAREAPDSADSHYWLGRVYAERKQYSDSLVFMKRGVDLAPEDPRLLHGLGQAYTEMQLFKAAEQTLEQASVLDPENIGLRFDLADLYRRRGDEAHAEEQYAYALEYATDDVSVRRGLGALGLHSDPDQLSEADQEKTLRLFDRMMSGPPRSVAAKYYVAVVYQRQQRLIDAEAGYQSVLVRDEGHTGANLHLARLYAETGRTDEAVAALEKMVARGGDPRVTQQAQQQLTGLLVGRAQELTGRIRNEADVREARRLGRLLLERNENDTTVAMLEAAAKVAPGNAEVQYLLGRAFVDRGEFAPGLAALERSVRLAPETLAITLRQHLAIAYERAGRLDDAIALHREIYRRAPDEEQRRQARVRLGLVLARQSSDAGNHAAALREYDELLRLFPSDVQLLTERGRTLTALGRHEEADQTFERLLEIAPQNVAVRLRLAEVYRTRGDTAKMLPQAAAIVAIDPFSPEAQQARLMLGYDKSIELLKSGSVDDAQETLERILTIIPNDPVVRFELGRTYFQQRKYSEAEHVLGDIIRDYPDHQEAHFVLGNIYQNLERRDNAIAEYEKVVALSRETNTGVLALQGLESLYTQRIQELIAAGQDEAAMLSLVKQIQSAPDNIAARINLAILYSRKQRYDEALQQLRELVRLQPNNPSFHAQMGTIYTVTQRNAQAAEAYAYAISLETKEDAVNRDLRDLLLALARYLLGEDKPFAAIRDLKMLNDMGLGDERTNFILGVLFRQQNRYDEAARAFRDAVRSAPDNAIMRFNLAELYERTTDYDLALLQYRQILRVGKPGERFVEEARRRADALKNRLALFSSQLQYGMTIGDSNVEEQDIAATGAINSTFSSSLVYNLGTNFWPTNSLNLRLDTGFVYVSNHSTQSDTFVPRIGLSSNLNYTNTFYSASAMVSDIRNLMLDISSGRTFNYNLTAGLRFRDTLALFRGWGRKKTAEPGETLVERAAEPSAAVAMVPERVTDNARLRAALQEVYRQLYPSFTLTRPEKEIRTHTIVKGDTLWSLSARFMRDPFRWRELHQLNPQIVNPDLIYVGDVLRLEPPQAAALFEEFDSEKMLEREENIRKGVDGAMDLFRTGQTLMRQGKLDAALKWFGLVLDIVPDDPLTLFNVGVIAHGKKEYARAERAYREALAGDPANRQIRLRLAELYEETGRVDEAIKTVEQITHPVPDETERAAEIAQLRNIYRHKADIVLGQPELSEDDVAMLLGISERLLEMENPDLAEHVTEGLLAKRPDSAEGNFRMAQIAQALSRPQQAVVHARRSVELVPDEGRYLLLLARAARDAGDYDQAEAVYRVLAAKEADGSLVDTARLELSVTQAERLDTERDPRSARETYIRLLEENPDDASLLVTTARLSDRLDLPEEAAGYYLRAITLEPGRLEYRLELADSYLRRDQQAKAREQLTGAMAIATTADERQAILDHLGFGAALEEIRQDRPDKALRILRDINKVAPDNVLVQLNIGVVYQRQEKYPEAEAQFQQILDRDPRNLNALLRLGMVYSETNRIDRAITVFEQVISAGSGLAVSERARAELQNIEQRRLRVLTGAEIESSEPLAKSLQARLFYSYSELPGRSITLTDNYGAGLTYFYRSVKRGDWIVNYTFNVRDNVDVLGSDYAYASHELGLTWRTSIPNVVQWLGTWFGTAEYIPGLTGTLGITQEQRYYANFDTNFLNILGRAESREQTVTTFTAGLNYQFPRIEQMAFYLNYTRGQIRASLPTGIIFSPEGIPISFQSSGLGDFDPNFLSLGMTFQF